MTGLAKSAPTSTSTIPVTQAPPAALPVFVDGLPLDVLRHFNIDTNTLDTFGRKQLTDIYDLLKGDNVLSNICDIELKLGVPKNGETRYSRVWNWLKIHQQIENLEKQREVLKR